MSDPNKSDNWRLEESGDTAGRWKLEETEQNRISQWELQNDTYLPEASWQPVEYSREPQQQGGGGWVLPSLVGLALIAVVTYGAWIGLTQLDLSNFGSLITSVASTPEPTAGVAVAGPVDPPTPLADVAPTEAPPPTNTVLPTDTPPPPTATPLPPVVVEERYVTVIETYGINARTAPSTEAERLRIIEQNEEFLVLGEEPGWVQILASADQLAWISSDPQFVSLRSAQLSVDEANQARAQLGVDLLPGGTPLVEGSPTAVAALPTAAPADPAVTLTETETITGLITPITPVNTDGATISGTVTITAGLNARRQPDANGELVTLLANGTVLNLTGRTADNSWLQSTVEGDTSVWVFAEFVTLADDITTLPIIDVAGIVVPAPAITSTVSLTTTTGLPETGSPDSGGEGAIASVNTILGAAIRQAPEAGADAIATAVFENVLTVSGRSADDRWLQVDMGEAGLGWVQLASVDLSVPLETLAVVTP